MKICNNFTHYNTNDLRKLFTAVLRKNIKAYGSYRWKDSLLVCIHYVGRWRENALSQRNIMGKALLGRPFICMFLSRNGPNKSSDIAYVFDHEIMHTRGLIHGIYSAGDFAYTKTLDFKWADFYIIRENPKRIK